MVRPRTLLWSGLLTIVVGLLGSLGGCGGGSSGLAHSGNSGGSGDPDSPASIYLTFQDLPPAILQLGKGVAVSALVTNDSSNSGVNWTCAPAGTCGSFKPVHTASGAATTYTAPLSFSPGAVTISGTSVANSKKIVSAQATMTPIQHVVIIFQENRSTDNLFQDPNLISAGADIVNVGLDHLGQQIPLTPGPLAVGFDPDHSHTAFVNAYDNGKMDGADLNTKGCYGQCGQYPEYTSVDPSQVGPYFQMAEQYVFADHMFETNQGPSYPAHQYILSATAVPSTQSNLFVAGNPYGNIQPGGDTGCTAPADQEVALIDATDGALSQTPPCFEHPTLTDFMDSQHLSWRYYTPNGGDFWTAPNSINHMCLPKNVNGQLECTSADWTNNVIQNFKQVLTDIAGGQLGSVTWVIPSGQVSDHPQETDGTGPSWVASVVNAVGNSPFWANTVIFIAWDDWGGFYDHVPPFNIRNQYEYGLRVPMIIVSPYAKTGYISHAPHHFGSILKYIEETLGLPAVGARSGVNYSDAYPDTDDLSDCFDYAATPTTFQTIPAPLGKKYFLKDKSVPLPPDTD